MWLSSPSSCPGTSRGSYPFRHSVSPYLHPYLYRGCYGNIMTMETPGTACDITRLINCGKWKAKQTSGLSPFIIFRFFLRKIASFWKGVIVIIVLMSKLKTRRKQNSDQPNILPLPPPPIISKLVQMFISTYWNDCLNQILNSGFVFLFAVVLLHVKAGTC